MAKPKQVNLKNMSPEKRKAYLKRKKQVERNRKILGMFIMTVIAVLIVLLLVFKVFFKVNTIKVTGKSVYDETQILNASGVEKGDSLLSCDAEEISESIRKNLPYIYEASVKKKLPSTVVIETKDTKAFMAVQTASGTAVADKDGKVLELVSSDKVTDKIIMLDAGTVFPAKIGENIFEPADGKEADKKLEEKAKILKTIVDAVNVSGIKDITGIDIKSANEISMMYQNRLKLSLGDLSDMEYKLKAAVQIIASENKAAPEERGEIFLSDTDNIYVSPEAN